jgi:hypothetical protein
MVIAVTLLVVGIVTGVMSAAVKVLALFCPEVKKNPALLVMSVMMVTLLATRLLWTLTRTLSAAPLIVILVTVMVLVLAKFILIMVSIIVLVVSIVMMVLRMVVVI